MHKKVQSRIDRRTLLGASALLGFAAPVPAHARATPGASPAAGDAYAHPEMLVDVPWLEGHLGDPSMILVGLMPADPFARGFILNSVNIDWPDLEVTDTSDDSLAAWQVDIERKLTNLGIYRDSTVVAYDEGFRPRSASFAAMTEPPAPDPTTTASASSVVSCSGTSGEIGFGTSGVGEIGPG